MVVFYPDTVTLHATVDDDGWVPDIGYLWEQVSGPGTATIVSPTSLDTVVSFPELTGFYIFKFTVTLPEHGSFLTSPDDKVLITEETAFNVLFAVQGSSTGFSDEIVGSAVCYVSVFVLGVSFEEEDLPGRDLYISIDGVEYVTGSTDLTKSVDRNTLVINETKDANPNTANFVVRGFYPEDGQEVIIRLDNERIFAGLVLRGQGNFNERWENRSDHVSVTDVSWHLSRWRITKHYSNTAASRIIDDIIALAPGFSVASIQSDLPAVTISFERVDLASALTQLCSSLSKCSWHCNYYKQIRIGEFDPSNSSLPLTFAHPSLESFSLDHDLGALISKIRVWGPSVSASTLAKAGDDRIYVGDASPFGVYSINSDGSQNFLPSEGGPILVSGTEDPLDPRTPASFETSFAYVGEDTVEEIVSAAIPKELNIDLSSVTSLEDVNPDVVELIRHTSLSANIIYPVNSDIDHIESFGGIKWRAISIDGTGLPAGPYVYYVTYTTPFGETNWKQRIDAALVEDIRTYFDQAEINIKWNAIEFGLGYTPPPVITRVNIYRSIDGDPRRCFLVGSLNTRAIFGRLGTETGANFQPDIVYYIGGSAVIFNVEGFLLAYSDLGKLKGQSSGTFIDTQTNFNLATDLTALVMPQKDSPVPDPTKIEEAIADESLPDPVLPDSVIPPEVLEPKVDPKTTRRQYLEVASGYQVYYNVPQGANIKRFIDFTDPIAQAYIASKLGDDGIIEGTPISGDFDTPYQVEAMYHAAKTEIYNHNAAHTGISWSSRDGDTHPHQIISVSLSPHCVGEFIIQSVTINGFELTSCSNGMMSRPLYTATADPRRVSQTGMPSSIVDLFQRMVQLANP